MTAERVPPPQGHKRARAEAPSPVLAESAMDRGLLTCPGTRDAQDAQGEDFLLTLWTDDPVLARAADRAGIDRIGVDIETRGKHERQAGLGTWISPHRTACLPEIRSALTKAQVFARVNPLSDDTPQEVESLLELGVAVLMLPMFRSAEEVARFVAIVDGRATVVPLLETVGASEDIASLTALAGIEEIHVGVNDLALELGMRNRFEILDCELIEHLSATVRAAGLRLGIGGIGRVDDASLPIPSDLVYAQYPRLGATAALLSRVFTDPRAEARELSVEVNRTRTRLARWFAASHSELQAARRAFRATLERCPDW